MADNSKIESAPTPSIKSLKSRFEQLALEHAASAPGLQVLPKPAPSQPQPQPQAITQSQTTQTKTHLASDVPSGPRASLMLDDRPVPPPRDLRTAPSSSDIRATAAKRAPPPPPPSRGKKPPQSPAASPLLRPVPVPAALRSPRASPERRPGGRGTSTEESSEDGGSPRVGSLRSGFALQVPPHPPPRHHGTSAHAGHHESSVTISTMTTPMSLIAPSLPSRRVTSDEVAPPLPARHCATQSNNTSNTTFQQTSPIGDRLPPPPTRTIGLGEKLPPVRHEESGSEEDPRIRAAESLPDSSRSSRHPPAISCFSYSESKIHVPAYSGHVAVTGSCVVASTPHHIKHYDLSSGDMPLWVIDTKEAGMRDAKVTCLEFRPASVEEDRGQFVWVGTKDGHLFEVDIRTGGLTASKLGAHTHHIIHMFRHGRTMITIDATGKLLVFDPETNASAGVGAGPTDDVSLVYTAPRVHRIGEKPEFAKMLGGLLWTSVRTEMSGAGAASVPVVRIHDVFAPGSIGRAVMPTQHVGAVTSGTILPSDPDHVYLGHEGGYISVWSIATGDGAPACMEAIKVSTSDVLCLEGVNDRLWAGGRKGMISVYDVSVRPWVVTNCWDAHAGLPVLRIFVDPYAIEKLGRLSVVSVGRDEQMRFWDGLLGADWVAQELLKREHAFSTFRDISVLIVSWNVDAAKPDALTTDPENINFLQDVLTSVDSPDIISFGFQELIDLESRKMAAKTVLLGGGKKKGEDGKISEKVTSSYKRWHDRLVQAVKLAMPTNSPYTVIHTESLVGLFTCMFVKNTERGSLKDVAIATIKRGMGGRYGNKGGIVARFVVDDSSLCFINCHLAAGQHHVRQRNADVAAFLEERDVFSPSDGVEVPLAYVGGGDGSMVLDHEIVFLNGDLNYRIDQRRDAVVSAIEVGDFESLQTHDQLLKEMRFNRGFRLRAFAEGALEFAPTYKYDRRTRTYDTSEKRRVPAWCDRVLWRTRDVGRVALLHYVRYEANVSDHRPVSAGFRVRVKRVGGAARERVRGEVGACWEGVRVGLLAGAREFYVGQGLV
ncbi:DNase I-like protein [Gyrodon lividus]|nr:DNase I-like protein [Gyrodon lividus]